MTTALETIREWEAVGRQLLDPWGEDHDEAHACHPGECPWVDLRALLKGTPPAPSDHGASGERDDRRQLFISLSAMCEAVAALLGGATTLAALADCANVARGVLLDSPLSHSADLEPTP